MELMQRHVDGDLNDEETSRLMDHVGHCPDCAAMLERLVRLSKGLEQLPRVVPPYSLVDAILPRLDQWDTASGEEETSAAAPPEPRSRRTERSRRTWAYRVSGTVAAGLVVGLLLVNGPFGMMGSHQRDASSSSAEILREADAPGASRKVEDQYGPVAQFSAPAVGTAGDAKNKSTASEDSSAGAGGASAPAVPVPSASPDASGKPTAADGVDMQTTVTTAPDGKAADNPAVRPEIGPLPSGADDELAQGFASSGAGSDAAEHPPSLEEGQGSSLLSITGEPDPTEEALSPDGQWRAAIAGGKLQLYRLSDGALVYESAPGDGTKSGLTWSDDSKVLSYTFTDADGTRTVIGLVVDSSGFKEIER
jgi:anti-sigma factor RsiW